MTVPQGVQHVEAASELVRSARQVIVELVGVDDEWKGSAQERLDRAIIQLGENEERFFLQTRMSLPFARRSEKAARKLETSVRTLHAGADGDGLADVSAALDALEKAVRTLDERSQLKGMAIT